MVLVVCLLVRRTPALGSAVTGKYSCADAVDVDVVTAAAVAVIIVADSLARAVPSASAGS